jgi:Flp pilus assembly protein protease CpaA
MANPACDVIKTSPLMTVNITVNDIKNLIKSNHIYFRRVTSSVMYQYFNGGQLKILRTLSKI